MRQGAVTITEDGAILYCNAAFARLARTPLRSIAGDPLGRFFVPGDLPACADCVERAAAER